ncbi:glycosyltransferase family 1 protein [Billgrantia tianxiuensis]|uniref:Glycosyltransferase family 1 protein n=2 Tax=Oceanospirillales TaxID=135619 RepID=A0A6I6SWY8_9GAMM|nr:glycosyltransferase family 4 protein [Halomonas sp. MCCC 1A11057]MCE8031560.1 glycosyltransferase family 4 protein [Halomonas sp. MCCC 1A11057]QHC52133.1 glycosyltransferase family 1 protein [Halomonas tianxiuensis]
MVVWNEFLNDARVLKEAQTLQSSGYQVVVHALHTPGVTEEREILASGVQVVRVSRSPLWKLRKRKRIEAERNAAKKSEKTKSQPQKVAAPPPETFMRQLLKLVARLWTHAGLAAQLVRSRPDVIHAHDVNVLPTAWLAAKIARVPLVYDAHEISTDREGYKAFRGLVGWLEKKLMPKAAGTITTTDARAKFFARAYGIPRPLVLQNRPRLVKVEGSNRIREELGLAEPWPIVLYQGGLQPGRGLPRLVEAAASVPHAYFVFIGGGRQAAELHELTAELGLEERVRFIPTVALSELPSYTASADVGVQPIENTCLNHFTTDSNKLFEYVIAGLPVVASQLPEIGKVVRTHDLGLLVPPGDTEALANAIRQLVESPELRAYHRAKAEQAAGSLNWESQERALVELYERILPSSRVAKAGR